MMKRIILVTVCGLISCTAAWAQNQISLPNGWQLSPAGRSVALGDLPLNITISNSKKLAAVTNNGQSTQSLQLIDIRSEKVLSTIDIPKSWLGIAFSADEKYLYASGGNDNRILKYSTAGKQLKLVDSIALGKPWPNKISPTGITLY